MRLAAFLARSCALEHKLRPPKFYSILAFAIDFRAPSIPRFSAEWVGYQQNSGLHNFPKSSITTNRDEDSHRALPEDEDSHRASPAGGGSTGHRGEGGDRCKGQDDEGGKGETP